MTSAENAGSELRRCVDEIIVERPGGQRSSLIYLPLHPKIHHALPWAAQQQAQHPSATSLFNELTATRLLF